MTFLAAVQTKLERDAYRTTADFSAWILEQTKTALQSRDPRQPALLAFPELLGLPLYFFLNRATSASQVQDAALELLRTHWLEGLKLGWQHLAIASALLPRAIQTHQALLEACSRAAQEHHVYIVAGSSFLPSIDSEAAKGLHIADTRVQNISYLIAPSGYLLSRTGKVHLTKGLESSLGLRTTRLEDWQPTQTKIGRIGTLICYDAFFDSCIAKADAAGTQILVQPSANAAKWTGAWSADATRIEGQEWLARGAISRIQQREHIQVVINPMLVGKLFELEFEGCSSIGFNGNQATIFASNYNDFAVVTTELAA